MTTQELKFIGDPESRRRLQDRVPLDAISADAHRARPGRAMQGLIGGFFYLIGFIVAKIFTVAFFAVTWCFSAAKMGWRSARGEELEQPDLEQVMRENDMLRKAIARIEQTGGPLG